LLARLSLARNRLGTKKKNQPLLSRNPYFLAKAVQERWDASSYPCHTQLGLWQRRCSQSPAEKHFKAFKEPCEHQLEFTVEAAVPVCGKGDCRVKQTRQLKAAFGVQSQCRHPFFTDSCTQGGRVQHTLAPKPGKHKRKAEVSQNCQQALLLSSDPHQTVIREHHMCMADFALDTAVGSSLQVEGPCRSSST